MHKMILIYAVLGLFQGYIATVLGQCSRSALTVTETSGEISSPDYPNDFEPDLQCNWLFPSKSHEMVVFSFADTKLYSLDDLARKKCNAFIGIGGVPIDCTTEEPFCVIFLSRSLGACATQDRFSGCKRVESIFPVSLSFSSAGNATNARGFLMEYTYVGCSSENRTMQTVGYEARLYNIVSTAPKSDASTPTSLMTSLASSPSNFYSLEIDQVQTSNKTYITASEQMTSQTPKLGSHALVVYITVAAAISLILTSVLTAVIYLIRRNHSAEGLKVEEVGVARESIRTISRACGTTGHGNRAFQADENADLGVPSTQRISTQMDSEMRRKEKATHPREKFKTGSRRKNYSLEMANTVLYGITLDEPNSVMATLKDIRDK